MSHHHHTHAHLGSSGNNAVPAEHAKLMRRATMASLIVASGLALMKIVGYSMTGALGMLTSLMDSLFDVVISLVNFAAMRYALKPADEDHRFGHTSIEDIAGLAQFAFITGSMLFVMVQSVQYLFNPHPIPHSSVGIGIMAISMVSTIGLVLYQRRVAKLTGSLIVKADALHYVTDILMNGGIIIALWVSSAFGVLWADPLLALCIAVYVIKEAFEIGIRAYNNLMDKEMSDEDKAKVLKIIESVEGIQGHHQLKTRYSGAKVFIQMHAEIDGGLSFSAAHEIADRLEHALEAAFPQAEVIIHQDPAH